MVEMVRRRLNHENAELELIRRNVEYFNFSGQRCIQNYNSYEANNTAYMTLRANPETTIRPLNSSHCNGQGYPDFAGNLIDETQ